MAVPSVYRNYGETALASYNWTDFISGLGYAKFYFLGLTSGFKLTQEAIPSATEAGNGEVITAGAADPGTIINFDSSVVTPFVIAAGKATSKILLTGSNSASGSVKVDIQKNGVSIGSDTKTVTLIASGGAAKYVIMDIQLTQTIFNPGDTLRVAITIIKSGGTYYYFYHDPVGRYVSAEAGSGASLTSDSYIVLPFKIDL